MQTTLCCSPWRASPGTSVLGICHAEPSRVPRRICWRVVSAICCTDMRWQNSRPLVFQYAFWQMQIPITHTHYIHSHSHSHTDTQCVARLRSFRTHSSSASSTALSFGYKFLLSLGWIGGGWRGNYPGSDTRLRLLLYMRCTMFHCVFNFEYSYRNLWLIVSLLHIHICIHIYTVCIYAYIYIYTCAYIYTYIESSGIYIYIWPPPFLTSSSFVSDDCFAVSVFFPFFFYFFLFFCLILNMWCSMLCSARFYSIMFFELFLCIEWELCFSPSDWVFPFQLTL